METYYYETVEPTAKNEENDNRIPRKHLLRQMLVCSGLYAVNFSYGLTFGTPTVLIPQLRREANSTEAVTVEMASWISSMINYSGAVSAIILAFLARLIGRKLSFLFICITSLIGYTVFYFSTNNIQIIISEILHGPIAGTPLTVSVMILTEYSSPQYRGVFLTLKAAIFLWGIWVANTIGTFWHWKNIGIIGFTCCTYSLLTVLIWPESPYWLVNKNRFEDCAASHYWLKGYSRESEAELKSLIEKRKMIQSSPGRQQRNIKSAVKMFRSKMFYKPLSLTLLVMSLYHFAGKLACGMYAIDIINQITLNESTAYTGMLILDGITILGAYVGCGLSKILKRKLMLLVLSAISVAFLILISLYLYLIHLEIITENVIISISLLIGYSLAVSIGPMIMSTTILGELIPIKYRSSSVLLIGFYTNILAACIMKITPSILYYFEVRGLFLFFAVIETLIIVIAQRVLPETKDKTILEIQESLLGTKSNNKSKVCIEGCD